MTDDIKTKIFQLWNPEKNTTKDVSEILGIPLEVVNMTIINKITPPVRGGTKSVINSSSPLSK